jgi:PAS domain S-box-containing protein
MLRQQAEVRWQPGRLELTRPFAVVGATFAILGGGLSLAGWIFGAPRFVDWFGSGITIKANAAICILSAGGALLLAAVAPQQRMLIRILSAFSLFFSALTFSQHISGINLGIDTLFFAEPEGALATASPGRMGIPASSSISIVGAAILCSTLNRRSRKFASLLGIIALAISSLSIVGYLFGASQLYDLPRLTGIALQTALMIAALALGAVGIVPEFGLAAALSRNDAGGVAFRRMFFPIIGLSTSLGALRLAGQNQGLYDTAFGTSARTLAEIWMLIGLLWWMSKGISEAQAETRLISKLPAENPYPVMRLSKDGKLLYANEAGAELAQDWGEGSGHPASADLRRWAKFAMDQGQSHVHEFTTGDRVYAGTFVPIPESDVVNVYASDITDRIRAEQALRENEERLRLATQAGKVGVWDWDVRGNHVSWTEPVYHMHGVKLGEFDGKVESFSSLIHLKDRDFVRTEIEKALHGEASYEVEFRVPMPDGSNNWLYTHAAVLRDSDGPYRMIGATVDITERKLGELELARAAAIVGSSRDAIVGKDLNGTITSWNLGAERLFGYSADEAVGRPISMLIPSDRVDEESGILDRLRKGEYIDHFETKRQHKDGTLLDISLTVSPLADANGQIVGASKIARDMTERKQAEVAKRDREIMSRLVEAQEAERHRIARDLHDHLGQQLTALRLKIESIRSKCDGNESLAMEMETLQIYASRLDMDINYLAWELRPTELDQLGLEDALGSFVREWSKTYGISAEFHGTKSNGPRLHADTETNLYRIVQEGLNNILKHAAATSVSVLFERRAGQATLIIEDNGGGFDPDSNGNNGAGRNGLGLIGMRERTALLGGTMDIESRPGEGTTVFVRIPDDLGIDENAA